MKASYELVSEYVDWAKDIQEASDDFLNIPSMRRLLKAKDPIAYLERKIGQAIVREKRAIKRDWDWDGLRQDAMAEGSAYLGSCFYLYPSGKYYTPFACGNVNIQEAMWDAVWQDALDEVAEKYNLYATGGEGDPTDVFVEVYHDTEMGD